MHRKEAVKKHSENFLKKNSRQESKIQGWIFDSMCSSRETKKRMPKTKKLSANYMDIVFVRNESRPWRQKNDGIVEIDMENTGFFNALAQKFFHRPRVSHISLDKYGSALWLALSGNATVNDVLQKMNEAFPAETDKMLNRVVQFLATLERTGFIKRM